MTRSTFLVERGRPQPATEVPDSVRENLRNWARDIARCLSSFPFERWRTHSLACQPDGSSRYALWSEDGYMLTFREKSGWVAMKLVDDVSFELPIEADTYYGFRLAHAALIFLKIMPNADIARLALEAPHALAGCLGALKAVDEGWENDAEAQEEVQHDAAV